MADILERDLYWLAGLLEGEGCFSIELSIRIRLAMTDLDVVIRAAEIMGCHSVVKTKRATKSGKDVYYIALNGEKAKDLMVRIAPLMGQRRKERIKMCLAEYELRNRLKDGGTKKAKKLRGPRVGCQNHVWLSSSAAGVQ